MTMIKLKHIINESFLDDNVPIGTGRSTDLTIKQAANIINDSGIIYSPDTYFPFRGIKYDVKYLMVQPSLHTRVSKHNNNIYTNLIDNSPYWKDYPKRSKSIICTCGYSYATEYSGANGNVYVVIPLDKNTKFGLCPKNDIWYSFSNLGFALDDLCSTIQMLHQQLSNYNVQAEHYKDYKVLLNFFDLVDNDKGRFDRILAENTASFNKQVIDYFRTWIKTSDMDLKSYLFMGMDPAKNGFKLINFYSDTTMFSGRDNECWTDSDCVLVSTDNASEMNDLLDYDLV